MCFAVSVLFFLSVKQKLTCLVSVEGEETVHLPCWYCIRVSSACQTNSFGNIVFTRISPLCGWASMFDILSQPNINVLYDTDCYSPANRHGLILIFISVKPCNSFDFMQVLIE